MSRHKRILRNTAILAAITVGLFLLFFGLCYAHIARQAG